MVGGGVARILAEQRDLIARRTGLVFDVRHVVVRDPGKARSIGKLPVSTDPHPAIDDPRAEISLATRPWERAWMIGMPPPQEASKEIAVLWRFASANSSRPRAASSDLFAVTTGLP